MMPDLDSIQKEKILDAIRKDDNTYCVYELQNKVENGIITWDDLREVFNDEQVNAIQNWKECPILPNCVPPQKPLSDYTEVYFWGTVATGKTCAIGAILSYAKQKGILIPRSTSHQFFMDKLTYLFQNRGISTICSLPNTFSRDSIAEMNFQLLDENKKKHNITFIDIQGEIIQDIYKMQNGIPLMETEKDTLDQFLSYLQNSHNFKIHFFLMEYGAANKEVRGLKGMGYNGIYQGDILTSIAQFLDNKGILRKSTVGVYGLVTKSDLIDGNLGTSPIDRPKLANDYVNQSFSAFWKTVNIACQKENIKDVKTIAFSIGHVFANNLCVLDNSDSEKIIHRLLLKTKPERKSIFRWLAKLGNKIEECHYM